jgi:hypothetical protein
MIDLLMLIFGGKKALQAYREHTEAIRQKTEALRELRKEREAECLTD